MWNNRIWRIKFSEAYPESKTSDGPKFVFGVFETFYSPGGKIECRGSIPKCGFFESLSELRKEFELINKDLAKHGVIKKFTFTESKTNEPIEGNESFSSAEDFVKSLRTNPLPPTLFSEKLKKIKI